MKSPEWKDGYCHGFDKDSNKFEKHIERISAHCNELEETLERVRAAAESQPFCDLRLAIRAALGPAPAQTLPVTCHLPARFLGVDVLALIEATEARIAELEAQAQAEPGCCACGSAPKNAQGKCASCADEDNESRFDFLGDYVRRAESAEARVAELEADVRSAHRSHADAVNAANARCAGLELQLTKYRPVTTPGQAAVLKAMAAIPACILREVRDDPETTVVERELYEAELVRRESEDK